MKVVVGLLLCVTTASAHTVAVDEVVASLATPANRVATGVERVRQDVRNTRVLVIRVGPGWFRLSRAARATVAADWHRTWRRSMRDGVVAVLDARNDRVVVRYGRAGAVAGLLDAG